MSIQPQSRLRPFQPIPFGSYILVSPLAAGGMGELFLALEKGKSTPCVIKKILPHLASGPDLLQRFIHEAKALAQLSHGSIARVLDMGIQGRRPYLVLEWVDGKDLRKVAARTRERNERLPPGITLYVMSRVLDALAYAHDKRDDEGNEIHLVHRDVSPPNIIVSYEGEVKVIDFGLAKSTLHTAKTHPSLLLGKFLYMSPEQARHQPVDRRSDLYSVGVCLYELLLGVNPFDGLTPAELLAEVSHPTFVDKHPPEGRLPDRVAKALRKALSVDPGNRFPTAEAFRDEVIACQAELEPAVGPDAVASWMQSAFAVEYTAERRLMKGAAELAIREGERETGIYRMPDNYPTPQGIPMGPTPEDLQARITPKSSAGVVPLSFAPVARTHETDDVGMVADAPTLPNTSAEATTQPELTVETSAKKPQRTFSRGNSKEALLKIPRVRGGSPMWFLAPLLIALSGLAGYLCWDLYRTDFFRPRPHTENPSWTRLQEAEVNEDELAPLVTSLGVGPRTSALVGAFENLRQQFMHFRHKQGCAGTRRALCSRYEDLAQEMQASLARGQESNERLLTQVRELSSELSDAQGM